MQPNTRLCHQVPVLPPSPLQRGITALGAGQGVALCRHRETAVSATAKRPTAFIAPKTPHREQAPHGGTHLVGDATPGEFTQCRQVNHRRVQHALEAELTATHAWLVTRCADWLLLVPRSGSAASRLLLCAPKRSGTRPGGASPGERGGAAVSGGDTQAAGQLAGLGAGQGTCWCRVEADVDSRGERGV
jgi:hypothetical protein